MIRRIPIIPTLIVLAAVVVMVRLGVWQLDRLHQKQALLARYVTAQADSSLQAATLEALKSGRTDQALYRRADMICREVIAWQAVAGSNAKNESGIAHIARCKTGPLEGSAQPPMFDVVVGWSNNPATPVWSGGSVSGRVSPGGKLGYRLVADPPLAGLAPNATPDPANIPNNHLSYAVQWFLFALTALVIYALALRKRLAAPGSEG